MEIFFVVLKYHFKLNCVVLVFFMDLGKINKIRTNGTSYRQLNNQETLF